MNNYICKAKSLETGEWVHGYYVLKDDPLYGFKYHYILHQECGKNDILDSFPTWCRVDHETLCRHIGWNDMHDTPIFENDIVEFKLVDESHKYLVWWNTESNMMTAVPLDGIVFNGCDYYNHLNMRYEEFCLMLMDPYGDYSDIKVIGNIFDNPELMENVRHLDYCGDESNGYREF